MRIILIVVAVIAAIWVAPVLISEDSGLKFGVSYRVLFTLFVLFAGFLFYLLRAPEWKPFKSTPRAVGSVGLVFVAVIGAIVLLANVSPQFASEGQASTGASSGERGKAAFFDPGVGCFLCHTVATSGGTRGPDLTHVATVAANRRPGLSVEDYLKESLFSPGAYVVATFDNIMPPFGDRLSPEQLKDILAYLMSLR
ncbi:MAG: c-type cytochrome [Chloroflexi bacterium]|nr:c-type cytochrome [Chloroflexota bacterium]